MSAPTISRITARRTLALRLQMPFATRIGQYSALTGTPTTTKLYDNVKLVATRRSTWNGQFVYMVDGNAAGDVRLIGDYVPQETMLILDEVLSAAPAAADKYEIHSRWSAASLHEALNHAIDQAFPAFYGVTVDETIPVQRDTVQYSLPSDVYRVLRMWIGQQSTLARGTATAGGGSTLTDSGQAWTTNAFASQKLSIVWGTGKGQIRTISSNTGTVLTVSAAWTTQPSTDSVYMIWENLRQPYDWMDLIAVRFDRPEYPTTFYLPMTFSAWEGLPIRVEYLYKPPAFAGATAALLDADTTPVPAGYLYPKAMAYLHALRTEIGATVDRQRHMDSMVAWETVAENYKQNEGWRAPQSTVWRGQDVGVMYRSYPVDYPLG